MTCHVNNKRICEGGRATQDFDAGTMDAFEKKQKA